MLRISRLLALPLLAGGLLMFAGASEAQAQIRVQVGGFGFSSGGHHSVYRGGHHFSSNRVYRPSYGAYNYGHRIPYGYGHGGHGPFYRGYHDTSHFDYHPPQIYRHGNHLHVQPGHYDFHRSGHYHH